MADPQHPTDRPDCEAVAGRPVASRVRHGRWSATATLVRTPHGEPLLGQAPVEAVRLARG